MTVCAWCGPALAQAGAQERAVSHTICLPCARSRLGALQGAAASTEARRASGLPEPGSSLPGFGSRFGSPGA
jgi:hypothetical protein